MPCDIGKSSLQYNMLRKLRAFDGDSKADTVLGTVINDNDTSFGPSSAVIWRDAVLYTVHKRDQVRGTTCYQEISDDWPDDWLSLTISEMAERLGA